MLFQLFAQRQANGFVTLLGLTVSTLSGSPFSASGDLTVASITALSSFAIANPLWFRVNSTSPCVPV